MSHDDFNPSTPLGHPSGDTPITPPTLGGGDNPLPAGFATQHPYQPPAHEAALQEQLARQAAEIQRQAAALAASQAQLLQREQLAQEQLAAQQARVAALEQQLRTQPSAPPTAPITAESLLHATACHVSVPILTTAHVTGEMERMVNPHTSPGFFDVQSQYTVPCAPGVVPLFFLPNLHQASENVDHKIKSADLTPQFPTLEANSHPHAVILAIAAAQLLISTVHPPAYVMINAALTNWGTYLRHGGEPVPDYAALNELLRVQMGSRAYERTVHALKHPYVAERDNIRDLVTRQSKIYALVSNRVLTHEVFNPLAHALKYFYNPSDHHDLASALSNTHTVWSAEMLLLLINTHANAWHQARLPRHPAPSRHDRGQGAQQPHGPSRSIPNPHPRPICDFCHIPGHTSAECRKKKAAAQAGHEKPPPGPRKRDPDSDPDPGSSNKKPAAPAAPAQAPASASHATHKTAGGGQAAHGRRKHEQDLLHVSFSSHTSFATGHGKDSSSQGTLTNQFPGSLPDAGASAFRPGEFATHTLKVDGSGSDPPTADIRLDCPDEACAASEHAEEAATRNDVGVRFGPTTSGAGDRTTNVPAFPNETPARVPLSDPLVGSRPSVDEAHAPFGVDGSVPMPSARESNVSPGAAAQDDTPPTGPFKPSAKKARPAPNPTRRVKCHATTTAARTTSGWGAPSLTTLLLYIIVGGAILGAHMVPTLLDSGSQASLVSAKLLRNLSIPYTPGAYGTAHGIGPQGMPLLGIAQIPIAFGHVRTDVQAFVYDPGPNPSAPEFLLGADVLHDWTVAFGRDPDHNPTLNVAGVPCYSADLGNGQQVFHPVDLVIDSPFSVDEDHADLLDGMDDSTGHAQADPRLASPPIQQPKLVLAQTIEPVDVRAVGTPDPALVEELHPDDLDTFMRIQEACIQLSELDLADAQAPERWAFDIQLMPGDHDLYEAPHQLNDAARARFNTWLKSALETGVIEEAPPGDHPAVTNHCQPLKPGSTERRISIVCRRLNPVTVPVPDDVVTAEAIRASIPDGHMRVMSVIDVRWAYNLIPIKENVRHLTTFHGYNGRFYRYKRMTFGLRNAGTYWNRYLRHLVSYLDFVRVYVDDIFIFSRTPAEHVEHLQQVIDILQRNHIPMRWQKIQLMRPTVRFLGSTWHSTGVVTANQDSIDAVVMCRIPRSRKELKAWLGLAQWIAGHVPRLNELLAPLHAAAGGTGKGDASFKLTPEQIDAFHASKEACANHIALATFDPLSDEPIEVYTDASNHACAGVLTQGGKVVFIYSYAFKGSQLRWSTIDKELYAIVRVLGKWRSHLEGRHFTLHTDHHPIVWIFRHNIGERGSPLHQRWVASLSAFCMTVHHIPGDQNPADWPTRPPFRIPETPYDDDGNPTPVMLTPPLSSDADDKILVHFLTVEDYEDVMTNPGNKDPFYEALLFMVRSDSNPDTWGNDHAHALHKSTCAKLWGRACIYHGRLTVRRPGHSDHVIVVPRHELPALIRGIHNSPLTGHPSVAATTAYMEERYYYPNMARYVKEELAHCDACNRANSGDAASVIEPFMAVRPGVRAHVDLIDMSKSPSEEGHNYILSYVDAGSRFVWLVPLFSKDASTVAQALLGIFLTLGFPLHLVSDHGTEFLNAVLSHITAAAQSKHTTPTVGNHRANGQVERFHRWVHSFIARSGLHKVWDKALKWAQYAWNTSTRIPTGFSPLYLMTGRHSALPNDEHFRPNPNSGDRIDLQRFVNERQANQDRALKNDEEYRAKMAGTYANKRGRGPDKPMAKEGSLIFVRIPDAAKHQPKFNGPYTVHEVVRHNDDAAPLTVFYYDENSRYLKAASGEFKLSLSADLVSLSRLPRSASPGSASPEREYIISNVFGARGPLKDQQFYVSWEGYGPQHNSWQSYADMPESLVPLLVQRFGRRDFPTDVINFKVTPDDISEVFDVIYSKITNTDGTHSKVMTGLLVGFRNDYMHSRMSVEFIYLSGDFFGDESIVTWPTANKRAQAHNAFKRGAWRNQ